MSNVLKKITKKYKWLRFLNYKTTKLAVLSAALFGLCLSSGASFAKYRDENYGGGNAGVAKFGAEPDIKYTLDAIKFPDNVDESDLGTYAYIAEFGIGFPEIEIKANYTLSINLVDYKSNINNIIPAKSSYFFDSNLQSKGEILTTYMNGDSGVVQTSGVMSYLTNSQFSTANNSTCYFSYGKRANSFNNGEFTSDVDWENWRSVEEQSGDGTSFSFPRTKEINQAFYDYYRIIFFVDMSDAYEMEFSMIYYNINVVQVD